ncbi:MAG: spore coat protein, partial [Oscillospiraceae bacterium]
YDTSIFEFKNKNVRDTLNHIQKEEQEHGEKIYGFMAQNGMYN